MIAFLNSGAFGIAAKFTELKAFVGREVVLYKL
jgi:hypothetical protein